MIRGRIRINATTRIRDRSEEISAEGHTATVGLLLHKPVIIGAVQATRRLQDGVMVSVDCARGIVQVMPQ